LLDASGLPKSLWSNAVRHIVWITNQILISDREGRKPLEAVPGMKADANAIPEWGGKSLSVTARLDSRVNKGRWAGVD
ncbi:hypothetical protein M378DRAFT_39886, partial [Amanita muscaria Koide BX008]